MSRRLDIKYPGYFEKLCDLVAKIALKYGGVGFRMFHISHETIREFWQHDIPYPVPRYVMGRVRVEHVKWYIHNHLKFEGDIWNADFLHGVAQNGNVHWNLKCFPSLHYINPNVTEILKTAPVGGKLSAHSNNTKIWKIVPALYYKCNKDSPSYLAGALSCADIFEEDGYKYAKIHRSLFKCIKESGIPIEREYKKFCLISPIWPALFSLKMPPDIGKKWFGLKKAYKADFYAPILWKTYISNTFPRHALPYLKSQRTIYNDFEKMEGEEGKILKKIDRARVSSGLTMLSNSVKNTVKLWREKYELEQCEKSSESGNDDNISSDSIV